MRQIVHFRKRFMYIVVVILSVFMMFAMGRTQVQAAVYTAETHSAGGIYVLENGERVDYVYVSGGRIDANIAVSGSNVYFVHSSSQSNLVTYNPVCTLYQKNMETGEYTSLKQLPADFFGYEVNCLYNGSIYLTGWNPSDNTALYRYYLSNKKLKQVANAGFGEKTGKYIVCESTMVHGCFVTYPILVYNTATGKKTLITKKAGGYSVYDGKVYYAETNNDPNRGMIDYTVKCYSPGSGKNVTVAKKVKAGFIGKITPQYVYSQIFSNSHRIYYRCSLQTKKNTKISKAAYERAVYNQ